MNAVQTDIELPTVAYHYDLVNLHGRFNLTINNRVIYFHSIFPSSISYYSALSICV